MSHCGVLEPWPLASTTNSAHAGRARARLLPHTRRAARARAHPRRPGISPTSERDPRRCEGDGQVRSAAQVTFLAPAPRSRAAPKPRFQWSRKSRGRFLKRWAPQVIDLLVLTQKFSTHVILKPWAGTRLSVMIDSRNRIDGGSSFKADHSPCRGARILPFSRSREIPARNSRASERSGPATQILLEDNQ